MEKMHKNLWSQIHRHQSLIKKGNYDYNKSFELYFPMRAVDMKILVVLSAITSQQNAPIVLRLKIKFLDTDSACFREGEQLKQQIVETYGFRVP